MSHIRQNVREAAAAAVTGLATTGTRVFKSRTLPLRQGDFPCLAVYARADVPDYSRASMGARSLVPRVIELHVQGFVKELDDETIEETLDDIAEEVEGALFDAFPFGGAQGLEVGEQSLQVDTQGDESLGIIDMVFNVLYRAAEGTPGTAI